MLNYTIISVGSLCARPGVMYMAAGKMIICHNNINDYISGDKIVNTVKKTQRIILFKLVQAVSNNLNYSVLYIL